MAVADQSSAVREVRALRAGPLTLLLDGPDIRRAHLGSSEIIRRIHVTVRDCNWETIPATVIWREVHERADHFEIDLAARHRAGHIDFAWSGRISGATDGTLRYRMNGLCRSEFEYNRIGICVLYPIAPYVGARFEAQTEAGIERGRLPLEIAPQRFKDGVYVPLIPACGELRFELDAGKVGVRFEGELWETEDQRNWTDASFKSFPTPMWRPFPQRSTANARLVQEITIEAERGYPPAPVHVGRIEPDRAVVTVGDPLDQRMPPIGIGLGCGTAELIRALAPAHVRIEVDVAAPEWSRRMQEQLDRCVAADVAVELAIFAERCAEDGAALERLDETLRPVRLARVLIFHRNSRSATASETTSRALVEFARERLGRECPLGGGTNMNFSELNRTRPPRHALDFLAWSINAQTHESDDRSVMETLEAQPATVASARSFSDDLPVCLGPITLAPRFNPVARDPAARSARPEQDPRLGTAFAEAWTAGSVAGLAHAGAAALTYFELPHHPGVLADACELAGRKLRRVAVDAPMSVSALAVEHRLLLANLTDSPMRVELRLPAEATVDLDRYGVELVPLC